MNPYAAFLGESDPLEVMAGTAAELDAIVRRSTEKDLDGVPAPGKWSIREIICHLADCEMVFAFRIRQALAEDNPVIQPFDQDLWARNYPAYRAEAALATFTAVRRWTLALLQSLPKDAFERKLTHPERGPLTLGTMLATIGGHDRNHLEQIKRLI
jgi:hypothetical protein